jgi:hypothetical protein
MSDYIAGQDDIPQDEAPEVDPLVALRESNTNRINAMIQNVGGLDTILLGVKVDVLLNLLLPEGSPFRHILDYQHEVKMNETLDAVEAQVRMAQLQTTVDMKLPPPPGQ